MMMKNIASLKKDKMCKYQCLTGSIGVKIKMCFIYGKAILIALIYGNVQNRNFIETRQKKGCVNNQQNVPFSRIT